MPERTGRVSGECLDPEVLSAYIDGTLDVRARAEVEVHLARCAECYDVMSEVLHIQEAIPAARPESTWDSAAAREVDSAPVPRPDGAAVVRGAFGRRKAVWGVAGGVLVAAAALVLVVRLQPAWWTGGVDPKLADLVEAVGEERTVEARLTGGFKYGPLRSPVRSGGRVGPTDNWRLLAAAGRIREEAEKDPSAENLHALGVASVLVDDWDRAIRALESSASLAESNTAVLNDLAVAYVTRAARADRPSDLPRALEILERIASDGLCMECRFNHAVVLELMHLDDDAIAAWNAYLESDSASSWSSEATTRRDTLVARRITPSFSSSISMPESPCLSDLFAAYNRGEMAQLASQASACTGQVMSPRAHDWAAYFLAVGYYYTGQFERAEALITSILDQPQSGSTEPQLQGRLHYVLGGLKFAQGAYELGLRSATRASDLLAPLDDREQLATVSQAIAELNRALGQPHEAWRAYLRALELSNTSANPIRRHALLNSLGLASLAAGAPRIAIRFLSAAEENASAASHPALLGEALLNRARSFNDVGDSTRAEEDLVAADSTVRGVTDPAIRVRLFAELNSAKAEVLSRRDPVRAADSAMAAIAYYEKLGVRFRQAALQLTLARAHAATGRHEDAKAALNVGVTLVESEQAKLEERRLRISHLDRTWEIYRDLVELAVNEGDVEKGLAILERQKSRLLRIDGHLTEIPRAVDIVAPDTLALVYLQTTSELLRWEVSARGILMTRTPVTPEKLSLLVARFRARISDPFDDSDAGYALSTLLLTGLEGTLLTANRIAVVPDGVIGEVPFGALRMPGDERSVSMRASTSMSSSLAEFVRIDRSAPRISPDTTVVVVAPPPALEEGLSPLSWAPHESKAIADLYQHSRALLDQRATPDAFTEALREADVVHFAGHAITDPVNPWRSRLLLAPQAGNPHGRWASTEIGARRIRALTVLAACSTAVGSQRRGAGVISLASEILAAGAPGVIATLWDVPDRDATQLFVRLHAELRKHQRPSDAVRAVQLEEGPPAKWALVAFGS